MTLQRYLQVALVGTCLSVAGTLALADTATWQLAMSDADVRDVVREVGAILDQTIVLDPRVQGRITVLSNEPHDREGVRRLFYSVLNAQGFAAVNDGDRLLVLPASEAKVWGEPASRRDPCCLHHAGVQPVGQHCRRSGGLAAAAGIEQWLHWPVQFCQCLGGYRLGCEPGPLASLGGTTGQRSAT